MEVSLHDLKITKWLMVLVIQQEDLPKVELHRLTIITDSMLNVNLGFMINHVNIWLKLTLKIVSFPKLVILNLQRLVRFIAAPANWQHNIQQQLTRKLASASIKDVRHDKCEIL